MTDSELSSQDPSAPSSEPSGASPRFDVHPQVFFTSAAIIVGFVVFTIFFHQKVGDFFGPLQAAISSNAGWFFVWTMNIILFFALYLMFSRYGDIRLGGEDAEPDFSTMSWFAMLFSAGMGIGLLFYGVAEPMYHFGASPFPAAGNTEAARTAMAITFLHWGFHPWAVYSIVGLALAFFSFNKGLPLSIRAVFYPLLGERIHGFWGNVIDILATVATLFGVATSLGFGVQQINAGLAHLFGWEQSATTQLWLIAGITAIATTSVVKGLDSGIRRLSELNVWLATGLLLFVLVCGPTLFIFNGLLENIGSYIQEFPRLATWSETFENTNWQNGWTVFYWGWWIAWSPFVGMFIARVSKGRTVREFIMGVLCVPAFVTFVWLTVFGNSALFIEMFGGGGIAEVVAKNVPVSLFVLLENFPFSNVSCLLGILVVVSFFVTSSDSGSMVIDIITAGGNPDPPIPQRLFWAVLEGVVAATLLLCGGLAALQSAVITTGLPFGVVLIIMCVSLKKGLNEYIGIQTFSVKTGKKKTEEFEIEGAEAPHVIFGRKKSA
ncbi:BCCT family transporter [Desulfoluna spongiiphila]|uniref:Choline/glycine/proline betaine transport protein n=1 Tax=Desulfoluna spongiiphila TaxID=419481 RepID=A0A1G5GRA9_9BACT|nr:BCCT family transporter [Desulfoluna spongiiphila]SCY54135.1 choline/glycine/proline betaine transport protein [Desulfoluna spongiiphila]VVS92861.1 consensus disorder prediction [Desulfoluna spongiiphila]